MHWRENNTLCGLLYLKLEDFFDATMQTLCLPLDPQGILIFEVAIITLKLTRLSGQSLKDCLRIDMFSNGGVANMIWFCYYSGVL